MKKLLLLLLLLALIVSAKSFANPLASHEDLVHDLAHMGAGEFIGFTGQLLLPADFKTQHPLGSAIILESAALTLNEAYELGAGHDVNTSLERDLFAVIGCRLTW